MPALELKVPPGIVTLIAAAVMWLAATGVPAADIPLPWRGLCAGLLFLAGLGVVVAAVVSFRRAKTTLNPMRPAEASTLVNSGIYRWSRNPMYLGLLLWLLGWACVVGNLLAWAVVPLWVMYLGRFQIMPEERSLAVQFGADYAAYCRRVRRWL